MVRKERTIMTASIQTKKGFMYVVLCYYVNGEKHLKWLSTGLKEKGNKKFLKSQLDDYIEKYSYLEEARLPEEVFFVPYLKKWLQDHKDTIAKSTGEAYEVVANAHIFPYFEERNLKLKNITPKVISEFYNFLHVSGNHKTGDGLSYSSIKKSATIIKSCLNDAYVLELISFNPAIGVKIPKGAGEKQFKRAYKTAEEAQEILEAFKGHELFPIVYMTLFYGLRRSEILGLKWENIDFEENTFEIKSTIVRIKSIIHSDETKTADSNATFELLPEFKDMLLELKAQDDENRRMLGSAYLDYGYAFCRPNGDFYRPDFISNKFSAVLKEAGLPHMRFHDLRHSAASVLYDLGWDIERIKSWLRHSDIKTTSNIYLHISKERRKIDAYELRDLYHQDKNDGEKNGDADTSTRPSI